MCSPAAAGTSWSSVSGTTVASWNFDTATLQGWTITPNSITPTSPVKWQLDTKRAASPSYSLYFGNPTTRLFEDPGNVVNGAATSPSFTLPSGQGKLCLAFSLHKQSETAPYDNITVTLQPSNTQVWKSTNETNNANSTATGPFLTFAANLTTYAGQTVQLKFYFDSLDSVANNYEGAYLDNVRVLSNCTP